jgi:hypothetical protein
MPLETRRSQIHCGRSEAQQALSERLRLLSGLFSRRCFDNRCG